MYVHHLTHGNQDISLKQKKNSPLKNVDYDTDESPSFLRSFTVTCVSHMYDVIERTNGWPVLLQGPPLTTLIGALVKCPLPDWPVEALSHWLSARTGDLKTAAAACGGVWKPKICRPQTHCRSEIAT